MNFLKYKNLLGLNSYEAFQYYLIKQFIRPCCQFLLLPLERLFQKRNLSLSPLMKIKFYFSRIYIDILFFLLINIGFYPRKNKFLYKNKEIIFSLATIEGRENSLMYALKSLIMQKTSFNAILVYLPNSSFNIMKKNKRIFSIFKKNKIHFFIKDNNLGSHRKYIFNYDYHQKFHMCLVDDDYFYDRWFLTDLIHSSFINDAKVVSLYNWKISLKSGNTYPEKRKNWQKKLINSRFKSSDLLTYVDNAYTFYESKILTKEFFNIKNIKNLCTMKFTGIVGFDDDWIKWNLYKNNIKVAYARRWSLTNSITEHIKIQKLNNHAYLSSKYDNTDNVVKRIIDFLEINFY
tara:strand:+ start:171 stop:1211 length:1041 start_codon:yes stop_codon:yes gene_type:complete